MAGPTALRASRRYPTDGDTRAAGRDGIIALDLLRGMAALLVFLAHTRSATFVAFGALPEEQQTAAVAALFGLTRLGYEAVMVFFVLSGFLVGGQVVNAVRNGTFSVPTYTLDRSTRILLPLIPACLLTAAIDWSVLAQSPDPVQLVLNMAGLNGLLAETLRSNAPLWSIAYEIWFYIFAGAVAALFTRRTSLAAWLVLLCAVAVFCVFPARYLLFWCLGAVAALNRNTAHASWLFAGGLAAFSAGTVSFELASDSQSFANIALLPKPLSELLLCAGVSLMLPFLCRPEVNDALAPLRGPTRHLSAVSYTLYLVHYPVNEALHAVLPRQASVGWDSLSIFALRAVVCVGVTLVFYGLFESRTAALRRTLRARLAPDRDRMTPGKNNPERSEAAPLAHS